MAINPLELEEFREFKQGKDKPVIDIEKVGADIDELTSVDKHVGDVLKTVDKTYKKIESVPNYITKNYEDITKMYTDFFGTSDEYDKNGKLVSAGKKGILGKSIFGKVYDGVKWAVEKLVKKTK